MVTGDPPKAGACFPELTRAERGVRWAVIDEFAPDETVNAGIIKNLTGGDDLYARDIQQKGKDVREMDPFFKLIFICNTIPNIRNPDNATWNRVRVIPFESTFKDSLEGISEEQQATEKIFLKDTSFCDNKDTAREIGEAFSWYMIQTFIKKEKDRINARKEKRSFMIKIPAKVIAATELYRAQGNAIVDYFNDNFERTDNENDIINTNLYFQDFASWFSKSHANKNVNMDKKKFQKLFTEHVKGDKNTFVCKFIKLKDRQEEDNTENCDGMPLF
jgi:phage/plasmid-associated DNA primase